MAAERLSAAQRSKIRRLSQPRELAPDEEGGELNIVPFLDIVMNVLMFVLATVSVTFTATIDTFPPKAGGGIRGPQTPTLGLAVLVVPEGFSLKTGGANIATGCNGPGSGVAIPKKGADYDYDGLKACAHQLKAQNPEFQSEMGVTISANPPIIYQVVINTMDALRTNPQGDPLFPEVSFGVVR